MEGEEVVLLLIEDFFIYIKKEKKLYKLMIFNLLRIKRKYE